jgi:hypothetical protein
VSPRALQNSVHPRLQSGAIARPLNFTVRFHRTHGYLYSSDITYTFLVREVCVRLLRRRGRRRDLAHGDFYAAGTIALAHTATLGRHANRRRSLPIRARFWALDLETPKVTPVKSNHRLERP